MKMKKYVTTTTETVVTLTRQELDEALKEFVLQRAAKADSSDILDCEVQFHYDVYEEAVTGVTLISRKSKQEEQE